MEENDLIVQRKSLVIISMAGKLKEKLPDIEIKRSSSVSKLAGGVRGVGYYTRVWDNLVSEAVRDIYNMETRNMAKPFKIYH